MCEALTLAPLAAAVAAAAAVVGCRCCGCDCMLIEVGRNCGRTRRSHYNRCYPRPRRATFDAGVLCARIHHMPRGTQGTRHVCTRALCTSVEAKVHAYRMQD